MILTHDEVNALMASDIPPTPSPEEVADLLHTTTRRIRHAFGHDLAPTGITPAQWRALRTVAWHDEPVRMSHLADRLGIARRSATSVVEELVARGLLQRGDDAADRRSVVVSATPAGLRVLDDVRERRRRTTAQALTDLSPAELSILAELLRRIGST